MNTRLMEAEERGFMKKRTEKNRKKYNSTDDIVTIIFILVIGIFIGVGTFLYFYDSDDDKDIKKYFAIESTYQ